MSHRDPEPNEPDDHGDWSIGTLVLGLAIGFIAALIRPRSWK